MRVVLRRCCPYCESRLLSVHSCMTKLTRRVTANKSVTHSMISVLCLHIETRVVAVSRANWRQQGVSWAVHSSERFTLHGELIVFYSYFYPVLFVCMSNIPSVSYFPDLFIHGRQELWLAGVSLCPIYLLQNTHCSVSSLFDH